jgi:hypothetical protein
MRVLSVVFVVSAAYLKLACGNSRAPPCSPQRGKACGNSRAPPWSPQSASHKTTGACGDGRWMSASRKTTGACGDGRWMSASRKTTGACGDGRWMSASRKTTGACGDGRECPYFRKISRVVRVYEVRSPVDHRVLDNELKLMSARRPGTLLHLLYFWLKTRRLGRLLKKNLVYTKQQAESTLRV